MRNMQQINDPYHQKVAKKTRMTDCRANYPTYFFRIEIIRTRPARPQTTRALPQNYRAKPFSPSRRAKQHRQPSMLILQQQDALARESNYQKYMNPAKNKQCSWQQMISPHISVDDTESGNEPYQQRTNKPHISTAIDQNNREQQVEY